MALPVGRVVLFGRAGKTISAPQILQRAFVVSPRLGVAAKYGLSRRKSTPGGSIGRHVASEAGGTGPRGCLLEFEALLS